MVDLLIPLDRTATSPLRDQIYQGLRAAILDGRLPRAARLPATRALAANIGVSRFTVEDAYARLAADGYTAARHGSGTFVASTVPAVNHRVATEHTVSDLDDPSRRRWSRWGERLGQAGVITDPLPARTIDFRHALPALDAFPHALWRRLLARAARPVSIASHHYGPVAGQPALRAAIADYLARSRGLPCDADQIVITSGTQQSLDLLARLWLDPGDTAAIEEPGYPAARLAFQLAGATVIPIPVDGEGLRVPLLAARAPAPKLVYVTPSHQYPTGTVLSLARRGQLLAWTQRHNALLVEDDYDSEFRYGARPVAALAGLEAERHGPRFAVYVGTFSKVLYPALRLGYVVLPPDLVQRFAGAKSVADRHAPTLEQTALAAFITGGHFERHLARMRRLYAARSRALLSALADQFGGAAHHDPYATAAGLHVLVAFDLPLTTGEIIARAAAADIHLDPATSCFATPPTLPTFLIGYASLPEERIREGVKRLARTLGAGNGRR